MPFPALQYNGFYHVNDVDSAWDTQTWDDYLEEIVDAEYKVNIVTVTTHNMAADWAFQKNAFQNDAFGIGRIKDGLEDFLPRAQAAGLPVVVEIRYIDAGTWANLVAALHTVIDATDRHPNIYAFCIDEPPAASSETFRAMTQQLEEEFPYIGRMVVMARTELEAAPTDMFEFCTDMAFDWYFWQPAVDAFEGHYARLEELAGNDQKIWLFPEGFVFDGEDLGDRLADILAALQLYYPFARHHRRIVGFMHFIYSPVSEIGEVFQATLRSILDPMDGDYDADIAALIQQIGEEIERISYRAAFQPDLFA